MAGKRFFAGQPGTIAAYLVFASAFAGVICGSQTHSPAIGAAAGIGLLVIGLALAFRTQRAGARAVAGLRPGHLEINAMLNFSSLPGEWRYLAPETMSAAFANDMAGMYVRLTVSDGLLLIQRRRIPFMGKAPFAAQIRLPAIKKVTAGSPQLSLVGSSLTFDLDSGEQLMADLSVGAEAATKIAAAFQAEVARGSAAPRPVGNPWQSWATQNVARHPGFSPTPATAAAVAHEAIEVTTPPPRIRMGQAECATLMLAFLPAVLLDLPDSYRAGVAAVVLTLGLVTAAFSMLVRRTPLRWVLAGLMAASAVAFVADYLISHQWVRLLGVPGCGAPAAAMFWWAAYRAKHPVRPGERTLFGPRPPRPQRPPAWRPPSTQTRS